jgi:poly(glycerol-phosphate) alpha-glucosyltransferase
MTALARLGYDRASCPAAGFLHALTHREAEDIRRETGRADSVTIANAGPAPGNLDPAARPPHVVYIGRIHPKKNLTGLIEGWTKARRGSDWRLTIAGWGADDDVAELRRLLDVAPPSIHFAGPVYGAAKQALLDGARFTVLPSLSEGLPMAILEGWAAGTPALMTSECNLPEGFAAGAAIDCGLDPATIARALESAMSLDAEHWQGMADAALSLAAGPFSAEEIAAHWAEAYQRLLAAPVRGA